MRLMKLTPVSSLSDRLRARRAARRDRAGRWPHSSCSASFRRVEDGDLADVRFAEVRADAVDEHALADRERRLHRAARDPVGLDDRTPGCRARGRARRAMITTSSTIEPTVDFDALLPACDVLHAGSGRRRESPASASPAIGAARLRLGVAPPAAVRLGAALAPRLRLALRRGRRRRRLRVSCVACSAGASTAASCGDGLLRGQRRRRRSRRVEASCSRPGSTVSSGPV